MSYDLSIRSDEDFSESRVFADLAAYLLSLTHVAPNGPRGFALDDPPSRWMEIDAEYRILGDEERDFDDDPDRIDFNCINIHIPYGHLGPKPERDYFPLIHAIAERIGWPVYDEQSGLVLSRGDGRA